MLSEIIAHLRATAKPPLRAVDGALDLAAITTVPQTPTAFVLPIGDNARPNDLATAISQQMTEDFGVLLVLRKHGDAQGKGKAEDFEPLRDLVRDTLLGFVPGTGRDPIEYRRGSLVKVENGEMWWLMTFTTGTTLRKV